MKLIKQIFYRNKTLGYLGLINLIFFSGLSLYAVFNETQILGINSMIKPIKFASSVWIYSWTMALLLYYLNDQKLVQNFSKMAFGVFLFEIVAIISQALRGELSHFNKSNLYGIVLFSLMGIAIFSITFYTLYLAWIFIRQKTFTISASFALSIQIGLVLFVVFSLFGGYISQQFAHTVGAADGGKGLPIINWSVKYGDLRVAHFFGIHSLQLIPLFGYLISKKYNESVALKAVWIFSILYLVFVCFTAVQAFLRVPFIAM
ncbi:hypothetical protein [Pedobacter sp. MW01-1-1]|uniref:hypothetical protein n=1 Tax=Pedobacter sp. MW01-1-1 TaxID=3383027 RepID=UPI003FF08D8A